MSDQTPPPPPRRKIAGEAAAPTQPARKAPTPRKRPSAAKKTATDETPAAATTPAATTAAKKTAAKKAPAKKAPAAKTAAKKAPAKKAADKKAPVKKAPAKKVQPKKSPASKGAGAAPVADGAVTEAPSTPASSTPASSTPASSTPVSSSIAATTTPATKAPATKAPATKTLAAKKRVSPTPGSRRTTVITAGAALVLVAGAVIGWFGLQHFLGESTEDNRTEAVAAATNAAETIFSFSFDDLDDHTAESKALMTPAYAEQFDQIAPALTDIAPQREVVVEAVARNAAVLPCGDECSADRASVLVFVDLDRRTQDDDASTVFGNRIVVDLVKGDGDWKVGDIRAL
ncbi:hypothetical protein [Aeromicrobium sp. CF3.5]|uniref:hypothetical protein n=1 Tax=Aeromicrobium sp. CF3.5 TaxID=3373078 RepID=UPI003EE5FF32